MKVTHSILWFVTALFALSVWNQPGSVLAQTPGGICSTIDQFGFEKQMNARAQEILASCGRAPTPPSLGKSGAPSFSTPANMGGTDKDVVLGGEGIYPHVTQSETQVWAEGNTSVVLYNDSRTAAGCYAGGSYSIDGGVSWTSLNSRPFCSGHGTNFGDPVVVFDKKHTQWLGVFISTGCGGQGLGAWRSTDGINWSAGACMHNGASDDRESGWADNAPSSPFYGRVYVSWNDFAAGSKIFSAFSNDGGVTWSAPVQVETNASFIRNVQLTTGPDGTAFIAGMNEGAGGLSPRSNFVYRSTNGGASWSEISMGASFTAPGSSVCGYFAAMFPAYWRHMGWGDIGAGPAGIIHYAYARGGSAGDFGDIYYTRSANNGLTWSPGIKLNTDSGGRQQWQPSLSVSPQGHVFVSWYDARNTVDTSYERWGRISNDNGLTWQADDVIGDASSPLPLQPDTTVQACYAGDYDRSFADGSAFYGAWVDGRVLVAGVPQQDVFFDRINDTASPPSLSSLTLTPNVVVGGNPATGLVTLSAPAPNAGAVVSLSSNNLAAVVPPSVTIPAGGTSANFTVTTTAVINSTAATISATYAGTTLTADLTINPQVVADNVTIQSADYSASKGQLRVSASDMSRGAVLKAYVTATDQLIGPLISVGRGAYSGVFPWPTNPQNITVKSSLGGSASKAVRPR